MTKPHNPLPSSNLNDTEAWPFLEGAEEIVLRVSRYGDDLKTPEAYQCIIRHRDRRHPGGVGIRSNPVSAVAAAITSFFRTPTPPPLTGKQGQAARAERIANAAIAASRAKVAEAEIEKVHQPAAASVEDLLG